MRCDEARAALTGEAAAGVPRSAVEAHLAVCPACRRLRALLTHVDTALDRGPQWVPPPGFVARVAATAGDVVPGLAPLSARPTAVDLWRPAAVGGGVALAGMVLGEAIRIGLAAETMAASGPAVAWGCTALALATGLWLTRRALA